MGADTTGENAQRQIPISKAEKAKMAKARNGGRAKGEKGTDTEARAAKDIAAKAKERAKDSEANACMVWF